jgi:hypothetical protein
MYARPRDLLDTVPKTPEHGENSIFVFIIVLMLLGLLGYLFIRHVIPVILTVICDFLKHSCDVAGGWSDAMRETGHGG